jgi:integrase
MWDATAPGLGLRTTPAGKPAYVFQGEYQGKSLRVTIGSPDAWTIGQAREKARELQRQIDEGRDPRELKAAAVAADIARRKDEAAQALTVGEAWARYLEERRPHWGERNYADHLTMTREGGQQRQRRPSEVTKPGPLAALMPMRLVDLDAPTVEAWAAKEAKERPARVRLALRLLKAFLRWAAAEPDLKGKADPTAASAKKAREAAGRPSLRDDVLERGQLAAWFEHVRAIANPVIAAYLQTLLLTGARPGEVLELRWDDLNAQWKGINIRDKVEGERQIPLTPYVWHLLNALPRRNEWVFSSTRTVATDEKNTARRARRHAAQGTEAPAGAIVQASASGRLVEPGIAHRRACAAAGLEGLTLHGLRRSFASLTEWLEIPAGVVAQIQGHKPSATAEKHYKRRPLDLLRVHHERIEAWILEQAGIAFDASAVRQGLQLVAS